MCMWEISALGKSQLLLPDVRLSGLSHFRDQLDSGYDQLGRKQNSKVICSPDASGIVQCQLLILHRLPSHPKWVASFLLQSQFDHSAKQSRCARRIRLGWAQGPLAEYHRSGFAIERGKGL